MKSLSLSDEIKQDKNGLLKLKNVRFNEEHADLENEEVFEPAESKTPKVVGKIDLDAIDDSTRPVKGGPTDGISTEFIISDADRDEIRRKVAAWQPNWKRIRTELSGINMYDYHDCEPIRIKTTDDRTAFAIGCLDPLKQTVGYYIAINLYGEGVVTKMSEKTMEDGVVAGLWSPDTVKSINKATTSEHNLVMSLLYPQIATEYTEFRDLLVNEFMELAEEQARRNAEDERKRQEEEQKRKEKGEAIKHIQEERERLLAEAAYEETEEPSFIGDDEVLSRNEKLDDLMFLPYVRGEKTPEIGEWPRISIDKSVRSYYYNLVGRTNLTFEKIGVTRDAGIPVRTYLLSRSYLREMNARKDELREKYDNFVDAMKQEGESGAGCVSWVNIHGVRQTIIWYVHYANSLNWNLIYLEEDDIVMHNVFTKRSGLGNDFSQTLYGSSSTVYTTNKSVLGRVISKLLLFFAMEREIEAGTIHGVAPAIVPDASTLGNDIITRSIQS